MKVTGGVIVMLVAASLAYHRLVWRG